MPISFIRAMSLIAFVGAAMNVSVVADTLSGSKVSVDLPPWAIGPFARAANNPIIQPNDQSVFTCPIRNEVVKWEELHTFNPAATVRDGKILVLYRAEDASGVMRIGGHTSRLGLATSEDGRIYKRLAAPVLFPADDDQKPNEWPGGIEDPRLVETSDGRYICTYTQYNGILARLAVASTRDFVTWKKHGPAFEQAFGGRYAGLWSKSGSIVCVQRGEHLVATKIQGKYWMYFGEGYVGVATSKDLINWSPVLDGDGELLRVLEARPGKFDSEFPEGGPAAIRTKAGIVVLYNGKNETDGTRDKSIDPGAYSGGQALFSASDPTQVLERLDDPFFRPEMPYERSGQYKDGTTFIEGLVFFKGQWHLYYGCADSLVGVATAKPNP